MAAPVYHWGFTDTRAGRQSLLAKCWTFLLSSHWNICASSSVLRLLVYCPWYDCLKDFIPLSIVAFAFLLQVTTAPLCCLQVTTAPLCCCWWPARSSCNYTLTHEETILKTQSNLIHWWKKRMDKLQHLHHRWLLQILHKVNLSWKERWLW